MAWADCNAGQEPSVLPSRALISRLATSTPISYPERKKKRAKRATRKKDSKGLLESLPYLVPKSPVNKRSGNKVLRSAGIIPFAICTTAKLLKR